MKGFQACAKNLSVNRDQMPFAASRFLTAWQWQFPDCPSEGKVVTCLLDPSAVRSSLRDPPLIHIIHSVADPLCAQELHRRSGEGE